jgi:hypothetical protein
MHHRGLEPEAKWKSVAEMNGPSQNPPPYPVCHLDELWLATKTHPTSASPSTPNRNGSAALNLPSATCSSAFPTTDASPANRFKVYPRSRLPVDAPVKSSGSFCAAPPMNADSKNWVSPPVLLAGDARVELQVGDEAPAVRRGDFSPQFRERGRVAEDPYRPIGTPTRFHFRS